MTLNALAKIALALLAAHILVTAVLFIAEAYGVLNVSAPVAGLITVVLCYLAYQADKRGRK
jgi:hypothetical protein